MAHSGVGFSQPIFSSLNNDWPWVPRKIIGGTERLPGARRTAVRHWTDSRIRQLLLNAIAKGDSAAAANSSGKTRTRVPSAKTARSHNRNQAVVQCIPN